MTEAAGLFDWWDEDDESVDAVLQVIAGRFAGISQPVFEPGEGLPTKVEVLTAAREEDQSGAVFCDERSGYGALAAGGIVGDNDLSATEFGSEILVGMSGEDGRFIS